MAIVNHLLGAGVGHEKLTSGQGFGYLEVSVGVRLVFEPTTKTSDSALPTDVMPGRGRRRTGRSGSSLAKGLQKPLHWPFKGGESRPFFSDGEDAEGTKVDVGWLDGESPTAESVAVRIWHRIDGHLEGARLVSVRLWETERNLVEYRGE